jgi:glycosyltransferase involved in cell wall biosynthesis
MGENNNLQLNEIPSLSVVVCTYSFGRLPFVIETVNSLLNQSQDINEILVVSSGGCELGEKIADAFSNNHIVKVLPFQESLSATQARNAGIKEATSDIIAFIDDDAIADKNWTACLLRTYTTMDTVAVGGKILPIWLGGQPDLLPEELYWLVGVTHESFAAERIREMRNTFGPNMSFYRHVFDSVGYFNEKLGFSQGGISYIQAEEPEFGLRIRKTLGKQVIYNPEAIVYHKIPVSKLRLAILLKRSFFQGYSKALVRKLVRATNSLGPERVFLRNLVKNSIPKRCRGLLLGPERLVGIKQLMVLLLSVISVGLGFIYGLLR